MDPSSIFRALDAIAAKGLIAPDCGSSSDAKKDVDTVHAVLKALIWVTSGQKMDDFLSSLSDEKKEKAENELNAIMEVMHGVLE